MPFTYTRDVPNPPNDPSVDVPDMQINTNSIDDIIDVDHYSFDDALSGKHKQVRLPTLGNYSVLPSGASLIQAGEGGLYTNTAGAETQLIYSQDNTGAAYQLTRTSLANYTKFATNIAYGTPPATFTQIGGWTFLPGGTLGAMLFQYGFYGKVGASGSSGTIQFPVTFTTGVFSVTIVANRADTSGGSGITVVNTTSPSGFTFVASTTANNGFFWQAIGV